jgi:GNAT superfamily N-acetyltransferase
VITLRHVTDADIFPFFRWWKHPETTRLFVHPKPDLSWDGHVEWFIENFYNPHWLVGEQVDGLAVGAVRLDDGYVSIVVAPEARGRGVGQALIRHASARYPKPLLAKIHQLNLPSIEVFTRAGYRLDPSRSSGVWQIYVLEKQDL